MTEQTTAQQAVIAGVWVDPAGDPRETDEPAVGEKVVLRQYLDHYRLTFEMKCEGLDARAAGDADRSRRAR